jgi:holo-[acyl-carrier-protein] synthase
MIRGLGLDVVELSRMQRSWERFGMRLAAKILHADELAAMPKAAAARFLASRFAAKEAAVKALGTGFAKGVLFVDIAVANLPGGEPVLRFQGVAAKRLAALGANKAHISLTHGRETVAAVVILENIPEGRHA